MLLQDLRYALRLMRRRVGYTAVVVATLAIGIGANTAMFSAIHAVLLRPLPYKDPSRLVQIWESDRLNHSPHGWVAPANFQDWRLDTHTFDSLAAYVPSDGTIVAPGSEPFHAQVAAITPNLFETLGVVPALGRAPQTADGNPGAARVLYLSANAWMTHFGADRAIVDRTIQYDGVPYRIAGVMPRGFAFPDPKTDGWCMWRANAAALDNRAQHFMSVIGRISEAAAPEQARADLVRVALVDEQRYPKTNNLRGVTMVPLHDAVVGDVTRPMYLLGAAVLLLLLIACANVANLMLVQGSLRRREMAIRLAVGADRFRLVRQLLIEGLLLAGASGVVGIALAGWATRALARIAVAYVPRVTGAHMDPTVLVFAVALSLATGLLFTFAPAIRASRGDIQRDLRDGARTIGARGRSLRTALVIVEFAGAVILVMGATLLLESFWRLVNVQSGFTTSHVLTARLDFPSDRYAARGGSLTNATNAEAPIQQFYSVLIQRLLTVPGVQAAAAVNNLPLSGDSWTTWFTVENRPIEPGEPPGVGLRAATPGYLAAMQIPLLRGRWIADSDTPSSERVLVINKALEDRFFPKGNALGKRARLGPNPKSPWRTIVGVIGNVHHGGPDVPADLEEFEPMAQDTMAGPLVVRATGDPAAVAAAVRDTSRSIDPAVVVWRMQWMDDLLDEYLAPRRLSMLLVEGFAVVALGLALLGIYGVMSYTVSQRTQEIGVRMALGARPGAIHSMVVRDGMRLAVIGLAVGFGAALMITRLAQSLLFDVSPTDPLACATTAVGVFVVALVACYLPARRAARVDPLVAMRAE
ncbi:MAG: ABC transporter permease [Vicinamibacterales bacterium]